MKSSTAEARAMDDDTLTRTIKLLRHELPRMQSLLDAAKREQRSRTRKAKRAVQA